MSTTVIEIFVIFALILANGIFAMSEMAVVSSRRARLQQLANEGDTDAEIALGLLERPTNFLSTVQIGITLIGILAGAFGGATIATELRDGLERFPTLKPYAHAVSVGIVVVCITFLSLIIGELVPKRLALNNPEGVARYVAGPMALLSRLASPLVRLLGASTDLVLKVFGVQTPEGPPVTEEEIKVMIEQGTRAGVFEEAEQDMMESVLALADRPVTRWMIPRGEMLWLRTSDPVGRVLKIVEASEHATLLVAEGELDNVVGIVRAKDLLLRIMSEQSLEWSALLTKALFVPESKSALQVLEMFKESESQMAVVLDEYGAVLGIVTINEILEAIVGALPGTGELEEPHAVQREDGTWLVDGRMPADRFKQLFELKMLPRESEERFNTVGGFVINFLERIPSEGDEFYCGGLRFEVLDMDRHRVDKVLVSKEAPLNADGAQEVQETSTETRD